jgi:tetratricopeptide (TPR) repeat protein
VWYVQTCHLYFSALQDGKKWLTYVGELHQQGLLVSGNPELLEMHPLVRAFFRSEFVLKHKGYQQRVHQELYCFYRDLDLSEKEFPDTLEEMQPLFSAVAHGCAAGMHQQALYEVYWPRIRREDDAYIAHKLGAFSDDLVAVAHFFTIPWQTPAAALTDSDIAVVLNWAGYSLRALGRLREAIEPMQANISMSVQQENWDEAALGASNLSELQLTLGDITNAISSAAQSEVYADKSEDMFQRMGGRTNHANALNQSGQLTQASELFQAAEVLQQERQPDYTYLYSLQGFLYCDLLLALGETEMVLERAEYDLDCWTNHFSNGSLLSFSLPKLTLGQAHLQQGNIKQATSWLEQAVAGLRAAGQQDHLPSGLLARAALFRHTHNFPLAHQDLKEVFDIADNSGMRLHLTDYHLEMARLLLAEQNTENLQHHIDEAKRLINETGYHRRDADLADLISQTTGSTTQRTSACSTT